MPRHVSLTEGGNGAPGLRSGADSVEPFSPATRGTGNGTGSDGNVCATVEKVARGERRTQACHTRADGFHEGWMPAANRRTRRKAHIAKGTAVAAPAAVAM